MLYWEYFCITAVIGLGVLALYIPMPESKAIGWTTISLGIIVGGTLLYLGYTSEKQRERAIERAIRQRREYITKLQVKTSEGIEKLAEDLNVPYGIMCDSLIYELQQETGRTISWHNADDLLLLQRKVSNELVKLAEKRLKQH